jgi:hypothetical protein
MTSAVKSRPTHYETLGLKPEATDEEIRRAFAREMSAIRPRAFGGIADVSIAYEVLRDPVRRRAYDESIGLTKERPKPPKTEWRTSPYLLRASAHPAPPAAAAAAPAPEPAPKPRPDPVAKAVPPPKPAVQPRHDYPPIPQLKPVAVRGGEETPIEWKRPAAAIGGVVAVVALVAAWAGSLAGNAAEPQQATRSVKLALAPAEPFPIDAASTAVTTQASARQQRSAHAVRRTRHQPTAAWAKAEPEATPAEAAQPYYAAAEPAETSAPAAAVVPASLPLPGKVIARTIERIGYACGQVASTTAGDAPGVFKVTCTSGHSYQAAPVRGRYHFRRLGGR